MPKNPLYRKLLVPAFIVSMLFLISCENNNSVPKSSGSGTSVEKLETIGAKRFDKLKQKYSDKIILVNFFASWCPPCKAETPDFIDVYQKHKDKFVILGLSIDDKKQDAIKFINDMGIPYPVFHAERSLQSRLNISSVPTNIFYSPGGSLYNFYVGALSEDFLERVISEIDG